MSNITVRRKKNFRDLAIFIGVVSSLFIIMGIVQTHPIFYSAGVIGIMISVTGIMFIATPFSRKTQIFSTIVAFIAGAGVITIPWLEAQPDLPDWTWHGYFPDELIVSQDSLLVRENDSITAIDLDTGEELWAYQDIQIFSLYTTNDGHVLAEGKNFTFLSPEGEQLWTKSFERTRIKPVAAFEDTVVLNLCAISSQSGKYDDCSLQGIDGSGYVLFEYSDQEPFSWALNSAVSYDRLVDPVDGSAALSTKPRTLPTFFLQNPIENTVELHDLDSGTVSKIKATSRLALSKDMVVHMVEEPTDELCSVSGTRSNGVEVWNESVPCFEWATIIESHLYAKVSEPISEMSPNGEELYDTIAINISTGQWQEFGPARVWNNGYDRMTGEPGVAVFIERDNEDLTAFDADTGEKLWKFSSSGEAVPGIISANNGVAVFDRYTSSLNPFAEITSGRAVYILNGKTGENVATWVGRGSPWTVLPVGTERTVVVSGGDVMMFGK